MKVIPETCRAN